MAENVFDENISKVLDKSNDKILVYQVNGPLFFGIVQNFMDELNHINKETEVLIIDLRHSNAIDSSAISVLKQLYRKCEKLNIKLVLTHVQEQPMKVLEKMGLKDMIGENHIYDSKVEAIKKAYKYISHENEEK